MQPPSVLVCLARLSLLSPKKTRGAESFARETRQFSGSWPRQKSLRPISGNSTTSWAVFKTVKFPAEVEALSVDTTWWTRYRSGTKNPDFGDTFPQAVPTLAVGHHPAIPRTDADLSPSDHLQAIANTAGFHFGTIEQGGTSLYPSVAQRVSNVEVLRIVLSIGPTEAMHFQTWQDKAGNAPALTDPTDPTLVFPNLNTTPGGEDFQTNLIMPEPTVFLSRDLPACSIVRPTNTKGVAMGALQFLTASGLFLGQSKEFFAFLRDLAEDADDARREGD